MDIVFFVYGLSFIVMGLAIALQLKEGSAFKWTGTLWLLAGFGLLHGANEWLDMWVIIKGTNKTVDLIRWLCLAGSYLYLFEFGRRIIRISIVDSPSCQLMAAKYMGWWLTAGAAGTVLFIGIISVPTIGRAAARYVLGFMGALMTAYGFYSYYRCDKKMLSKINVKKYFFITSMSFFIYSILGGLVVNRVDFFPADILNTGSFLKVVGIPVQVFRAGIAMAVAFSVINILKIFNWEITNRQKENLLRLQISEERYRTLIETIPDIVYRVDKDGIFIFVNDAVNMLGYEPGELLGQHFSMIVSPEDVGLVSRSIVLSNRTDKNSIPKLFDERRTGARCTFGLEVRIVKKKHSGSSGASSDIMFGEVIVGEVNSSGIYEINEISNEKEFAGTLGLIKPKKTAAGSTGVIRDITVRKREMDQLRMSEQMMEEVAQNLQNMVNEEIRSKLKREQILVQQSKLATMGEMIAVIAHQWKQPLNVIGLIAQDIADAYGYEGLDEEYINKAVKSVFEQIDFMTKTIDDFRDFLSPSKEKVRFCLVKAIEEILFMYEKMLKRKDIIILFDKEDLTYNYEITGYPNEFKHVILNLINNARDAILALGTKDGRINIGLTKKDGKLFITIRDNGGGIPPEIIERIFEAYFSTKPEQEGTGIGLYMSKTIIENRMGGRLTARDIDGGAELRIELQAE